MNTEYEFMPEAEDKIVYIRAVEVADLPKDVQEQAMGIERLYAVHDANGTRLALVKDRNMAFILARQHDLAPVTVH